MSWQPQDEPLRQLAQVLKDSLSGQDKTAQKNAELMLRQAKASPDFSNYLTFLISATDAPASISMPRDNYNITRSAAAIALKNYIRTSYKTMQEPSKEYVRSVILQGLSDPSIQIRSYAGNVITEMVKQGGILAWPQLFMNLFAILENKDGSFSAECQEGASSALFKICEDNKNALDREYQGERPLAFLLPKLLEFTRSDIPRVRWTSLSAINIFLPEPSSLVEAHLPTLLSRLFELAHDKSDDVRKHVCRSFLHIAEISPDSIIPNLEGLVNYTLLQQKNQDDPELALDAAEFWICLGEDERLVEHLRPFLPSIVPVLLESMIYSEEEILQLEGDDADADIDDREEDIKPVFASNKAAKSAGNGDASTANGSGRDDASEGEVSDDEFGDPESQWSLRKCSAAALDVLATHFHDPVFDVTLPYLKENLQHNDWPNREAAVLALGAIADGCMAAVQPNLPDLTPYLLTLLQDREAVVRQITCWTLGRYSSWAAHLDNAGRQQFFEPIMDGILKRMLDSNKRVQEAAASAFANLEDKAKTQLQPYCRVIIQQFSICFSRYKDRNMFILYDCVQTLAEHIGPQLQSPDLVELLMSALIQRWNKVTDQSREMLPLLECLSYVATALADFFAPFAQPIYSRCTNIIRQNLENSAKAQENAAWDQPEKDFLVTSLDLLSAIIQAIEEPNSSRLVAESTPNLFQLLAYCMKDENNDVRQSAYALLGDCAIYVFDQLRPYLDEILQVVILQLDLNQVQYDAEETNYSVINNACWSVGEIAMRQKEGMQPHVRQLLERLVTILNNETVPDSLYENAAIALGRLGMGCAADLAPYLESFAPRFLKAMNQIQWTDEKAHALIGFAQIVMLRPEAMEQSLGPLFQELAVAPIEGLQVGDGSRLVTFKELVSKYKNLPGFENFIAMLPSGQLQDFKAKYLSS